MYEYVYGAHDDRLINASSVYQQTVTGLATCKIPFWQAAAESPRLDHLPRELEAVSAPRDTMLCLLLFSYLHYVSAETFLKTSVFKGVVFWEWPHRNSAISTLETTEPSVLQSLKHAIRQVFS